MNFNNTFTFLPKIFYENVEPTPLKEATLFALNQKLKANLELNIADNDLLNWFNGTVRLPNDQRISTRYAGHQFGVWAGQLGDGRAISIGELCLDDNFKSRYEIQTKGSGQTPFSRFGDGRAVLRSSVREYLCSEHMNALGVPTTRALALILGTDQVHRETIERSALVVRVFPTNIRFGHFEYAFHENLSHELQQLIEYCRTYFYPECLTIEDMILQITLNTAQMVAHWMSIGFCHGVMNSDNMSILGITIDYGPYGFMEDYNPNWICNHSDERGRYSYINQPQVALWNIDRLLWCFSDLIEKPKLQFVFDSFYPEFLKTKLQLFKVKFGFAFNLPNDEDLINEFLRILETQKLDFTYSFRQLGNLVTEPYDSLVTTDYFKKPYWNDWIVKYKNRLQVESCTNEELKNRILKNNPKYILRNYIAQEIIEAVEKNNTELFDKWYNVLITPYEEHIEFDKYSQPTPEPFKNIILSCSS